MENSKKKLFLGALKEATKQEEIADDAANKALDWRKIAADMLATMTPEEKKDLPIDTSITNKELGNRVQKKDYPFDATFEEKMEYLDKKFPNAWRLKDRKDIIEFHEGNNSKTLNSFNKKLEDLIKAGKLVSAKFADSNKYVFYLKPEWRSEEKPYVIKRKYLPNPNIIKNLSPEKQTKITWKIK
jgi:hypothetical protein